jgi:hypothetical protein
MFAVEVAPDPLLVVYSLIYIQGLTIYVNTTCHVHRTVDMFAEADIVCRLLAVLRVTLSSLYSSEAVILLEFPEALIS